MTHPRPAGRATSLLLLCLAVSCAAAPGGSFEPALAPLGPEPRENGAARVAALPPSGPIMLKISEALVLALENNPSVRIARLQPSIQETLADSERAAFDPVLGAEASWAGSEAERLARIGSGTESYGSETASVAASASMHLPTGTDVALEGETGRTVSSLYSDSFSQSRLGLSVTQALLQGRKIAVNNARIDQALIDARISKFELRGFAEAMAAQIVGAYWAYALAAREVEIVRESLALAEQQERETEERIQIGMLAETERAAARALTAQRKVDRIEAEAAEELARLRLAGLLGLPTKDFADRPIVLLDRPVPPRFKPDPVEEHVRLALAMRPEVNQAKLLMERRELEVVRTADGLLPVLEVFFNLGKTGYAESFIGSVEKLASPSYDVSAGLRAELPLFRRSASAAHRRAQVDLRLAEEAFANLKRTVELDVRAAHIEAVRARERIIATRATRELREEAARVEREKFHVGRSTTFLVGQAERDLLESRIAEVRTVVGTLVADLNLHRLDGSLLTRRGISAPGAEPVEGRKGK